ncbi:MAG TPA: MFS transporter [Rhizomicrobium sp.]|nr:MFS transporter [Rhizomicrobium sp.]
MPKIRWLIIWMCFLANAISYIDRANLAIATPAIRAELGIDPATMGWVLSTFFWTYAVMQLPAGWFVDRIGVRISLAFAVVWWSLFTAATGAARGIWQFVGVRLMLGVGESASLPSFTRTAFNWFPRAERGMACGIFNSGSTAGSALSLPLVTALIIVLGWRGAFIVTGAFGIVWAIAWWFVYRDPEQYRAIAPREVDALLAERSAPAAAKAAKISWLDLFRYRSIWGLMIGLFCLNFAIYFYITWFPSYLLQARGFSLTALGTIGALPAVMAVVGNWVGGYASDRLIKLGWSHTAARKTCLVGGMAMASSIGLSAFVESTWACLALLTLAYASLSFTGANVWTVASEIAPTPGHVASIGGIQNFAGNLAGIMISAFTGKMLALSHGSFLVPLATAGALCLVGALSYLFLVGKVEPLGSGSP